MSRSFATQALSRTAKNKMAQAPQHNIIININKMLALMTLTMATNMGLRSMTILVTMVMDDGIHIYAINIVF